MLKVMHHKLNASIEDSEIELELIIEEENKCDSGKDNHDEPENFVDSLTAKDETEWRSSALTNA